MRLDASQRFLSHLRLVILTPNALGCDRVAATALALHWRSLTEWNSDLLCFEAAEQVQTDEIAMDAKDLEFSEIEGQSLRLRLATGCR